jgi:hypothetical protein
MKLEGRAGGIAALVVLGVVAVLLALFAFTRGGSSPSTSTAATPTETQPGGLPVTVIPTGPAAPGSATGGSFDLALPRGAAAVKRTSASGRDQVTFSVGSIQGAVSSQPVRVGESLDELASIYGKLKGHKRGDIAGKDAYVFTASSGGRFSVIVIGRKQGKDYTVQLVGPQKDFNRARALADKLGSSVKPTG